MRTNNQSRDSASDAENFCRDAVRRITIVKQKDRRALSRIQVFALIVDGRTLMVSPCRKSLHDYLDALTPDPVLTLVNDNAPESFDPYNTARFRKVS